VSNKSFNPDQTATSTIMGSTTFGNITPAMAGRMEPTTSEIDRARFRRVRSGGPA
jgi:hypothetical protein